MPRLLVSDAVVAQVGRANIATLERELLPPVAQGWRCGLPVDIAGAADEAVTLSILVPVAGQQGGITLFDHAGCGPSSVLSHEEFLAQASSAPATGVPEARPGLITEGERRV